MPAPLPGLGSPGDVASLLRWARRLVASPRVRESDAGMGPPLCMRLFWKDPVSTKPACQLRGGTMDTAECPECRVQSPGSTPKQVLTGSVRLQIPLTCRSYKCASCLNPWSDILSKGTWCAVQARGCRAWYSASACCRCTGACACSLTAAHTSALTHPRRTAAALAAAQTRMRRCSGRPCCTWKASPTAWRCVLAPCSAACVVGSPFCNSDDLSLFKLRYS